MSQRPAKQPKISEALADRLNRLPPDQAIRLILLVQVPTTSDQPVGRASRRATRAATIEAVRAAAQPGLAEVDRILAQHDGRRLNGDLSALGAVAVETTAQGAHALAESDQVRALLEDQPVRGILANGR